MYNEQNTLANIEYLPHYERSWDYGDGRIAYSKIGEFTFRRARRFDTLPVSVNKHHECVCIDLHSSSLHGWEIISIFFLFFFSSPSKFCISDQISSRSNKFELWILLRITNVYTFIFVYLIVSFIVIIKTNNQHGKNEECQLVFATAINVLKMARIKLQLSKEC